MVQRALVSATLQATVLSATSNVMAQIVRARQKEQPLALNIIELLRFVAMTLITAPPNYKWQQLLERTFPGYPASDTSDSLPLTQRDAKRRDSHPRDNTRQMESVAGEDYVTGTAPSGRKKKLDLRNTFCKWFIDCITLGTLVNTVAFVVIMGILKGYDVGQIQESVHIETGPILLAGYKIWPIVSVISFSFIPVEKRIVFVSCFGLVWGVYLSLVAARV